MFPRRDRVVLRPSLLQHMTPTEEGRKVQGNWIDIVSFCTFGPILEPSYPHRIGLSRAV